MDLRNNKITVKELMNNPASRQLLLKELAGWVNPQMISFASNMTLATVMNFAKGRLSEKKVEEIIDKLKKI